MKDRNTEKGEKEGVKATTLILIFEEVNRHRTLSGPTSSRPAMDRGGEGGLTRACIQSPTPPALPPITCSVGEIIV